MKIGNSNIYYQCYGEERYRKMKSFGFTHVDYCMSDSYSQLCACGKEEIRNKLLYEKKLIEDAGMEVGQVHGPWCWPPIDDTSAGRAERGERMKKSIQGAAILGCKNWVVHPIMPCKNRDYICDKGTEDAHVTWELNQIFMSELLQVAKEYDVTICLENMPCPQFSLASPMEILEFVKVMDDEHFKICLDTGHAAVYKDMTPADAVRTLGEEVRALHVHDNNGGMDQHTLPYYYGCIDWKDFGQAIKECQFDGVFSYETAPSAKLPVSVFEEMNVMMVNIAKGILKA